MLGAERRRLILERLAATGLVEARQLVEQLGVSPDTVRRDLDDLAEDGLLERVRGGAVQPASVPLLASERRLLEVDEKRHLAGVAAALVRRGDVVMIDAGSTNVLIAAALPRDRALTVLTSSPAAAAALAGRTDVSLVVLGGKIDPTVEAVVESEAAVAIGRVTGSVAFVGTCSVDPALGLTALRYEEVAIKQAMVRSCQRIVAVATAAKRSTAGPWHVADVSDITDLVTTGPLEDTECGRYEAASVTVHCVGAPGGPL